MKHNEKYLLATKLWNELRMRVSSPIIGNSFDNEKLVGLAKDDRIPYYMYVARALMATKNPYVTVTRESNGAGRPKVIGTFTGSPIYIDYIAEVIDTARKKYEKAYRDKHEVWVDLALKSIDERPGIGKFSDEELVAELRQRNYVVTATRSL